MLVMCVKAFKKMEIDKSVMIGQLIVLLEQQYNDVALAVDTAHERATHSETKAENKYDTFGLEASYLAHGQAKRLEEIKQALMYFQQWKPVDDKSSVTLGTVAVLENEEGIQQGYLLAEYGGGIEIEGEGHKVTVVTPKSPLGQAMIGKEIDDEVVVNLQGKTVIYDLFAIF